MVSGAKTKDRKSPSVQLDYVITIIKIKPWPPSHSPRSLRSALIQWEHVEFNESFKLHVTLMRDLSIKAGESDTFLKNCIEFNMYEPRRDKTIKGQLLATAVVDFAEYGVVKDGLIIQASDKNNRVRSSSRDSLVREGSMDRNCLMNEENVEETESASITDDDVSSCK
ncbi:hypothetical protein L2E82_46837 [Cichorium intybus]|uniref:Uncharacterized protein n=1 Tax=Cichorium intybus TaxID=13427 RepID=A0ACB8YUI5_CICIN|nr:hypothetical protein L2E82_46837 [Cichorium intybus]